MSSAEIEQMNKLRKSLGLPLLSVSGQAPPSSEGPVFKERSASDDDDDSDRDDDEPASTLETREAAGYENWNQLQADEKMRVEREKRKRQIQKQRDLESRSKKLEGRGLGEAGDDGDLETKAWLKGQRKRQSKIQVERSERLARELAEREQEAARAYTAKDLAGVHVAHEMGDFDTGAPEHILTLKDTEIGKGDGSEDEDVLENADLVAQEKLQEKLDLKKRKVYDVNDDSEKGLLSQYDDKKRKAFALDERGVAVEDRDAKRQHIGEKLKNTISLDILKPEPVSDYMEIKMKKPKKEKKKSKRSKLDDDDDIFPPEAPRAGNAMNLDGDSSRPTNHRSSGDQFNDDDDFLSAALATSRKAALKKEKRKAIDIVKQLQQEAADEVSTEGESTGGLVLDDTTVFLDTLLTRPKDETTPKTVTKSIEPQSPDIQSESKNEDDDHAMGEAYGGLEDDEELLDRLRHEQAAGPAEISHSGLGEEQQLDQGLGATLNLLRSRGLLNEVDPSDRTALYKDRQKFIIEARLREHENEQKARLQRERDRQSGKLTGMSVKEREEHARWQNSQREHQSSIQAAAAFNREYKPDVQIKYVDDDGRLMNQKEAFKYLSHQFHGKGSGKMKTEKRLKKIADEKKRDATSVLDSSRATGMSNAQGAMGRKNKEAGVRLA